MSDIQKRHFYRDVITHLEEIVELYDDSELGEEEIDDSDDEALTEKSTLDTFIAHIRDALETAEEHS